MTIVSSRGWKALEALGLILGVIPPCFGAAIWLWGEGLAHVALAVAFSGVVGFVGGVVAAPRFKGFPRCSRLSETRLNAEYDDYLKKWKRRVHRAGTSAIDESPVEDVMLPKSSVLTVSAEDDGRWVLDQLLARMGALRDEALPIACVVEKNQELVGIVTPSDLLAKFDRFHPTGKVNVKDLMTSPSYSLKKDQTWGEAEEFRSNKGVASGLPVLDKRGRLCGFLPPMGGRQRQGP